MQIRKGDEITLTITDAAYEGKGLGRIGEQVVFVRNTAPGDTVTARVIKKKKNYLEGRLTGVLEPGGVRTDPRCRHAGICGGCTWQHVTYEEQLRFKNRHVKDHMQRIGGFSETEVLPALGSEKTFHYRNKMEYTFGDRRWLTEEEIAASGEIPDRDVALGLHIPGRFDRILNLEECHLQDPVSWQIMAFIRDYAIRNDIPPFNPVKHEGFFRNVMIRNAEHTADLMVNVVTYSDEPELMADLTASLLDAFPGITTVVNNVNDTRSPDSEGRYENVLHGPGYITETILGFRFNIAANTFFQTNTLQAEKLYRTAIDYAGLGGHETVYDLYCGIGSLTLCLGERSAKVVGIEINPVSVTKARINAVENNADNCHFETGDMKDTFTGLLLDRYGRPDVIVTDPPRAGMHPDVIATLLECAPERIVYVSCNSATQARDLALLAAKYTVEVVQPVDMFPQTYHIESVAKLSLRKSG